MRLPLVGRRRRSASGPVWVEVRGLVLQSEHEIVDYLPRIRLALSNWRALQKWARRDSLGVSERVIRS
jgi:hypothetical protein